MPRCLTPFTYHTHTPPCLPFPIPPHLHTHFFLHCLPCAAVPALVAVLPGGDILQFGTGLGEDYHCVDLCPLPPSLCIVVFLLYLLPLQFPLPLRDCLYLCLAPSPCPLRALTPAALHFYVRYFAHAHTFCILLLSQRLYTPDISPPRTRLLSRLAYMKTRVGWFIYLILPFAFMIFTLLPLRIFGFSLYLYNVCLPVHTQHMRTTVVTRTFYIHLFYALYVVTRFYILLF